MKNLLLLSIILSLINFSIHADDYDILISSGKTITIETNQITKVKCGNPIIPKCRVKLVEGNIDNGTYKIWAGEDLIAVVSNYGLHKAGIRLKNEILNLKAAKVCQ